MLQTSFWCPWQWQTCWWVSWSCPCHSLQSCTVSHFPSCYSTLSQGILWGCSNLLCPICVWRVSLWTWPWVCAEVRVLLGEGDALLGAELVSMLPEMTREWCWQRFFYCWGHPEKLQQWVKSLPFGWTAPEMKKKLRSVYAADPTLSQVRISPWAPTDVSWIWAIARASG